MNILLVGEYNRTHFNIKKGLEQIGHKATLVSNIDGFKKIDVDIEIIELDETKLFKVLYNLKLDFITKKITSYYVKKQFKRHKQVLSGFDIIQLVNEAPFNVDLKSQIKIFEWLKLWNKTAIFFLLSCGLDYPSVLYAYEKKFRYSILTPYFEGKVSKKDPAIGLRYLKKNYKKLHYYVYNLINGVISKDLDYHLPLIGYNKYLGMIPHAIDTSVLKYSEPIIKDKIVIFHGINTYNYYKKGNDIFDEALDLIKYKFKDKAEIIVTRNLPYKEYIKSFDRAHILLDQVYAYDQGFNALEAMAKGKVVFTGAEKEWENYFNVKTDTIAINALPNAKSIASKLEWLIENPEKIVQISKKARSFVDKAHNYVDCAKQYVSIWSTAIKNQP